MVKQLSTAEIETRISHVQAAPKDGGTVEMIVARPSTDDRLVLEQGEFTIENGLEGDNWRPRGSSYTEDGGAHPDMQITLMNGRYLDLIADGERERWPLAGDQLIVDLDLSDENLQTGDKLEIGTAVFEVTPMPHNGCAKFSKRFGVDALKFANSPFGKSLHLRGIYVKVIQPGTVSIGDTISKI